MGIIDTARNRAVYAELVELLRSRRAMAFVGSGVTSPLGYPCWDRLIDRLANEVRAMTGEEIRSNGPRMTVEQVVRELKSEPLVQAQILKQSLGERYFSLMGEIFGPKEQRIAPIADLVSLPFKHLLTSNYDRGLEQHHTPANQPISICLYHDSAPEFITTFADDNYGRRVVHVHGRDDEPRQIILTEEDYGTYVRSPVLEQFWQVVPVATRLVFFGFSFRDMDILYSFRHVRMALRANQHNPARHFAIMPLDDPANEGPSTYLLDAKYGIAPIFFLKKDGSFAEYDDLLSTLKSDVGRKIPDQLASVPALEVVVYVQPPPMPLVEGDQASETAVQEGIDSLRRMTEENINRRQTGDLE
jgi:hypothetical protein